MKTSVNISSEVLDRVNAYNRKHPDQKIVRSGVCQIALEKKLAEVEDDEGKEIKK